MAVIPKNIINDNFPGYKSKGGDYKRKFEAMVGFGGGILIGVMICSILWILALVFDIMSAMIRKFILPIIKSVQCKSFLIIMYQP